MKSLRRILKLLPPACLMRVWLKWRYGMSVQPMPCGIVGRVVLEILPYAFTVALSQRVATDSRLVKYLLPYGSMKRYVRATYGMKVGNDAKDHDFGGFVRAIMPYGLVLWWDSEGVQSAGCADEKVSAASSCALDLGFPTSIRQVPGRDRLDRIEVLELRRVISDGHSAPSNFVRHVCNVMGADTVAGPPLPTYEDVFFKTPNRRAWDRWRIADDRKLEVDMIFSVGGDCVAAAQQRNRGLRPYSLPFDWCFSDGEASLARFAEMLDDDFRDFALLDNLRPIPDTRFGYVDVRSGYRFIHHFKVPVEVPGEYRRFREILDRRIRRFFDEIERSTTVLCLLSRTWKLKGDCLEPLARVLKRRWPDKTFHFAMVTYNSRPASIERTGNLLTIRIPRDRTDYDMKEKVFEWSFLDSVTFSRSSLMHFKELMAAASPEDGSGNLGGDGR